MAKKYAHFCRKITVNGVEYESLREACATYNVSYYGILNRLHHGMTPDEAFSKPLRKPRPITGIAHHRLARTWYNMVSRCYGAPSAAYQDYGARGIEIYQPWLDDPREFVKYCEEVLGWTPEKLDVQKLTIDRIDVNGNYEPGNLRLATKQEQSLNTRANRKYWKEVEGINVAKLAREHNMHPRTLRARLINGWDLEKALTTPVQQRKKVDHSESKITSREKISKPRKLTWEQVREIRAKFATGNYTKVGLGKEYGITHKTVERIVKRMIWKNDPLEAKAE